jgi:non-heme chloroperoxidase
MKKLLGMMAMGICFIAVGQPAYKHAAFNAQKQSVNLRTGITMKYIDTGNRQGTPVLLLHGYTDSGRSYERTIEELTRLNSRLRVIVPDLRGHGETSMPDADKCAGAPEKCFTPADFASDIIAFMDQLNVPKAHIVGHSMGSIIAQELALKHTGRVSSLVLIGTFVNGKECAGIHEFMQPVMINGKLKAAFTRRPHAQWPKDAYAVTPAELGPEITGFLQENWVVEMATDPAYLDAILRETIHVPVGTWVGVIAALGKIDNREAMTELQVPTLVLNASQDMVVPEADQIPVKTSLQQAAARYGTPIIYKTYGKIPLPDSGIQDSDLGHNLQWAVPRQVAADISAFIRERYPVAEISYINPDDKSRIITEKSSGNIIDFRQKK